jgi:cobalt-zinc-cadmium efflux system protein
MSVSNVPATHAMRSSAAQHRQALWVTFGLTSSSLAAEVVAGILTNSLALLADAGHMLTDVGGLGLALFASWMSGNPATPEKTYGYYRVEILAVLANAIALFGISGYILYEAYRRFQHPAEVASIPMIAVAVVGLIINLLSLRLLRTGAEASLNLRGALLEVLSDTLSSVGVIAAGAIMWLTGWRYADPIVSAFIGLFILPRTWRLLGGALNVLLEATPAHISLPAVERAMLEVEGVARVHDLHVWTLTSGVEAMSVHVVLKPSTPSTGSQAILHVLAERLQRQFGIVHSTIQIEEPAYREEERPF